MSDRLPGLPEVKWRELPGYEPQSIAEEDKAPLTVRELIAILQTMPQDARVVVDGYEGGLKDLLRENVTLAEITIDEWKGMLDYYGPHEHEGDWTPESEGEMAVYLAR